MKPEDLLSFSAHRLREPGFVDGLLDGVLSEEASDEREEALRILVERLAREWLLKDAGDIVEKMNPIVVERAWAGTKLAGRMIEAGAYDSAKRLLQDATQSAISCGGLDPIAPLMAVSASYRAMGDIDGAESVLGWAEERLRAALESPANHQDEADAQKLAARLSQAWALLERPSRGRELLSCVAHPAIRERALSQIQDIERARKLDVPKV